MKKVLPFLLLPFATHYLNPEQMGTVQLLNQAATLLTPIALLGSTWGSKRDYYKLPFEQFRQRWTSAFWLPLFTMTCISVICFLGRNYLLPLFDIAPEWWWYLPVTALLWAWWELVFGSMRVLKMPKQLGILQNTSVLAEILLVLFFIISLQMRIEGMLAAQLISASITVAVALFIVLKYNFFDPRLSLKTFINYAFRDLGFLPLAFFFVFLKLSDRFLVGYFWGREGLGYYSVAFGLSSAVVLVLRSFTLAYTPWLFEQLAKNTPASVQKINRSLAFIIGGIILSTTGAALVLPLVFVLFFSKQYLPSLPYLFPAILIGALFSAGQLLNGFYIYFEKSKTVNLQGVALLLLLGLTAYFEKQHGSNMQTMLYSLVVVHAAMLLVNIGLIRRFFPLFKAPLLSN